MIKLRPLIAGVLVFGLPLLTVSFFPTEPTSHAIAQTAPSQADTTFSSDAVNHLSKLRKIDMDDARKRIEWQDRADSLNNRLADRLPSAEFGGVWIDKNTDRVKVGVLNNSNRDGVGHSIVLGEIRKNNLEDAVDLVQVNHSYVELLAVKKWISATAQNEGINKGKWPMQIGITTDTNQVIIHIPEDETKVSVKLSVLIDEAKNKYGDMIRVQAYEEPALDQTCNPWFCDSPLRGGVEIRGSNNGYEEQEQQQAPPDCTLGFNVVGDSGTRYAVTAGHCALKGHGWASKKNNYTTEKIGPVYINLRNREGTNKIDAMIIKIREDVYDWNVKGWVYMRNGTAIIPWNPPSYNEEYDITGTSTSGSLVGQRVCVSGAASGGHEGGSCGPIHEVEGDYTSGGVTTYHVVRAGYCSRGGDSGAPVIRNGKALGIHIAATNASNICSNYKHYTGIESVINAIGSISIF